MTLKRIAARAISEIFALRPARPQNGLRILLYHSVGPGLANNSYGLSVAPGTFEQQMKLLLQTKEPTIVRLDQPQFNEPGFRVALTFDDGYKDNLYFAAPILARLEIPFTAFVTISYVRSGSSEYLTPPELRELASMPGAFIGSHGLTHSRLAACDDQSLARELNDSRRALEDLLGTEVDAISYPHGSVNSRVRDAATQAGYRIGVTSRFGINDRDQDPLLLNRCEIVTQDTDRVFTQKLNGHWDWKARRES